jgi:tetratricopeptide (TPR) repeat protein
MKIRLLLLLFMLCAAGLAQTPRPHKPLTQEEILELTRNYVPSQRLADLVHQFGINFTPSDDFLQEIRTAGGEDVLITALREAKAKQPANAAAPDASYAEVKQHLARASELKKGKQYAQAEREYRAALKLDPDRADVHFSLGYVLLEQKQWAGAAAENREALRLRPEMAAAHNNLGIALARQGNLDGAIGEYQQAVDIRPKYALAHHNLGSALEKKGNLEAAAKELRLASQLEPNNAGYRAAAEKLAAHAPASPAAAKEVPTVHLKLDAVRFFETGPEVAPEAQRKYAVRFKHGSTRLIACELAVLHPRTTARVDFDIEVFWYGPGDNLAHRHTFHTYVPAGSERSLHVPSWGCPEHPCSYWQKGSYHVDFAVGNTKIGTGLFEIY